jgi:hypothetical protein
MNMNNMREIYEASKVCKRRFMNKTAMKEKNSGMLKKYT